ncbi:hypothetical protein [Streptomyces sp. NBC_00503]|uniref:hypothetical protein n=1 Tax=Streptomyces sp. NBC_00503 TaxID=2903659 RepID=UPI002E814142|nr:hypothetical protein [Streptomyces sp. NBC_00503]WUD84934.1 hypothetical protein OG490_32705 [Streptomyces sp. NBC_00503]
MTRTTPPRPLDVEALFPELAAHRATTTRLHPRPGSPDASVSSVGGPLLWPADEPWPVCTEPHRHRSGRRPEDIHRERRVLATAWARDPDSGPTDEERSLLAELRRRHRVTGAEETDPLPLIGLAQLYRKDVPDLLAGPDGCDLLQVFWCPFDAHGENRTGMLTDLRWRRSWEVAEVLAEPARPQVVGYEGYVPEPCVLHPEQVVTYPFAGLLPEELSARIEAREEALEEAAEQADLEEEEWDWPTYQFDLSIPPGWRAGGHASWNLTDASAMDCPTCATPMRLLLTIDSSEWGGGHHSWQPREDRAPAAADAGEPTRTTVGRWGKLNVFACPADPGHPHRRSIQ